MLLFDVYGCYCLMCMDVTLYFRRVFLLYTNIKTKIYRTENFSIFGECAVWSLARKEEHVG
jgi:hypothetical protein